jgi:hypothetical protein
MRLVVAALPVRGRRDGGDTDGRPQGHVRPSGSFSKGEKEVDRSNLPITQKIKKIKINMAPHILVLAPPNFGTVLTYLVPLGTYTLVPPIFAPSDFFE